MKMKLGKVHDEQAQGVIEFALIATVLMFLFLGTVDYARFLYYAAALRNSARVGAEVASNHCPSAALCSGSSATGTDYVMWSAYCEGQNQISLQPTYGSCSAGSSSTWDPGGGSSNCAQDICVLWRTGGASSTTPGPEGSQVSVYVGYNFRPISFLMNPFFSTRSCYPDAVVDSGATASDAASNKHTLCSRTVGKVS